MFRKSNTLIPAPKKILIIKLRAIGDVVLSTVVVPNLRQAFPDAQIDFLTERLAAEVVEGNPDINQVLVLDRIQMQTLSPWRQLAANIGFIRRLQREKYDWVFDFFGNPRSALLTFLSRATDRIGYNWRGRKFAYHHQVVSRADRVHEAEFHLDALSAMGIPIVSRKLCFPIDAAARQMAQQFLDAHQLAGHLVVGLNCSGGWSAKRWPLERFAALGDRLIEELNAKIILFWGPGEQDLVQTVADSMRHPAWLTPPTTLKQLGALLQSCDLLVSNDSGPMHMAAALDVPTVGIFGPTNPALQGPYGTIHEIVRKESLDCLACNQTRCDHNNCMQQLTVDEVWDGILRCMAKNHLTPLPELN